jgi:SEC-C motif-containing protein
MKRRAAALACPCGGADYAACCGRFHQGAIPASAQELMRSRYSAYALGLHDYLYASWHPRTRPAPGSLEQDGAARWLGLEVRSHQQQGDEATVEFIARCRIKDQGRAQRMHEISRFLREDGRWFYLDGSFPEDRQ